MLSWSQKQILSVFPPGPARGDVNPLMNSFFCGTPRAESLVEINTGST